MNPLIEKLRASSENQVALPFTIALHRFERDHQDFSRPRIFIRKYNDLGLTMAFELNHGYKQLYGRKVERFMNEIYSNSSKREENLDRWLSDSETNHRIMMMILSDGAEASLYNAFKRNGTLGSKNINKLPHLFLYNYDEEGIPFSYKLNPYIFRDISLEESGAIALTFTDNVPFMKQSGKVRIIPEGVK